MMYTTFSAIKFILQLLHFIIDRYKSGVIPEPMQGLH